MTKNTPEVLSGLKVVDLGYGAGRDVFWMSKLVGEQGHVTGLDLQEDRVRGTIKMATREHLELPSSLKSSIYTG